MLWVIQLGDNGLARLITQSPHRSNDGQPSLMFLECLHQASLGLGAKDIMMNQIGPSS